jgi:hypothetical protein
MRATSFPHVKKIASSRWLAGGRTASLACLVCAAASLARAQQDTTPSALPDTPTPLSPETFPARPAPLVDLGQSPFLGSGYIAPGFEIPTGAVWQPDFIVFGTLRTALQTFDNGTTDTTEWANRLDIFGNLYFTPTERILVGYRPLDTLGAYPNGDFSGYKFTPSDERGTVNALNGKVITAFFEGDFGELFPNLDPKDVKSIDYGFAVGRQTLVSQDGLLINDTMDAVGITRSSLFLLGSDAAHVTAVFAWNNISRGDNLRDDSAKLIGLLSSFDYPKQTFDVDLVYVPAPDSGGGDGVYAGLGVTQRFGFINSTIRIVTSYAVRPDSAAVGTGTLLFNQLSLTPPHTYNNLYWDTFVGIGHFTSAGRDPDAAGPLTSMGLLFSPPDIGSYGSALSSSPTQAAGTLVGYQIYFANRRDQLVLEVGGRTNTNGPTSTATAAGAQWEQAIGRHLVLVFAGFVGKQESVGTNCGLRSELDVKF